MVDVETDGRADMVGPLLSVPRGWAQERPDFGLAPPTGDDERVLETGGVGTGVASSSRTATALGDGCTRLVVTEAVPVYEPKGVLTGLLDARARSGAKDGLGRPGVGHA